jgi:hypothetical protein
MKIVLPENIQDITLEQFQKYALLLKREDLDDYQFNKRKVEIFTSIKYHDLNNVANKDFEDILKQIDIALNADVPFVDRFKLNGVEFGFIPNFDKMTAKEFTDLSLYPLEDIETYHKLMAILFRPVIKDDAFKNYDIETYNGTEKYADVMKRTPMNIVNGALIFFYNLANELEIAIQRYTIQELARVQKHRTILKNGDGIPQSKS